MLDGNLEWMRRIRQSVDEVLSLTGRGRVLRLGEVEAICKRHGAQMHNVLAEISVRCVVDYGKGTVSCRK